MRLSRGQHLKYAFCVFLNHITLKEHWMMLHLQPLLDKVSIMLARGMTRLSWSMPGERVLQVCQVNNLTVRRDSNHSFWLVYQRCPHIHSVDIATEWEWPTIEHLIKRLHSAQCMAIRHLVNSPIGPTENIVAKLLA